LADEKRGGPNRLLNAVARGRFPHELSWLIDNPVRRALLDPETLAARLPLREDARVLELGPGSGFFSAALARRLPRGRLELVDVQPEMLEKAREKLDSQGFTNIGYTAADADTDLPFPDADFDLALLVAVLGEISDKVTCITSLRRVLRAAGVLAIHEHLPDPDFIPFERLRALVQPLGFVLRERLGPKWNYTATFTVAVS
jgi:ubiquinone/menaquinone biosynthesis C-methylase UbiE